MLSATLLVVLCAGPSPQKVPAARLDFVVQSTTQNQRPISRAPWFESGGRWTVLDCVAGDVHFILARTEENLRFGPLVPEARTSLIAALGKALKVPAPTKAPGSGFVFLEGHAGPEYLSGGGFGDSDQPIPVVYGKDVIGSFGAVYLGPDGGGHLVRFSISPDGKGWLASDFGTQLLERLAAGAPAAGPAWKPLGPAGGRFAGFSSDGRALVLEPTSKGTAILAIELSKRVSSRLGEVPGPVQSVVCGSSAKSCIAATGSELWKVDLGREARLLTGFSSTKLTMWLSPSGQWLATYEQAPICIPHGCSDHLRIRRVTSAERVLDLDLGRRGLFNLPGAGWQQKAGREVLLADVGGGTLKLFDPSTRTTTEVKDASVAKGEAVPGTLRTWSPDMAWVLESGMTKDAHVRLRDRLTGSARDLDVKEYVSWLGSKSLVVASTPFKILDAKTLEVRASIATPDTTVEFTALHPALTWVVGVLEDQLFVAATTPVP